MLKVNSKALTKPDVLASVPQLLLIRNSWTEFPVDLNPFAEAKKNQS